jgi:hypothetical protein
MMQTRWFPWTAVLLTGVLALPAAGGEAPLAQLPAETPVLVSLRGLQATRERLATMIKNGEPDLAPLVTAQMDAALEKVLDGRKLAGLDPNGPLFLAFTSLPSPGQGGSPVALVARVTDYKALRNGFLKAEERNSLKKERAGVEVATIEGKEVYLLHRDSYLVATAEKEVLDKFLDLKGATLQSTLSKDIAAQLQGSDLAVYVNMAAVNKEFGAMIPTFRQMLLGVIDQAAGSEGQFDKNTAQLAKMSIEALFQGVQDSKHVLLTTSIRPEGLALHVEVGVGKDTPSNKLLKEAKVGPLTDLATLPPGYVGYQAMELWPAALKALQPLMLVVMGFPEAEGREALRKALDEVVAAGPGVLLSAEGTPTRRLKVDRYKEPARALDALLKVHQAVAGSKQYNLFPLKEPAVFRLNAETFRGNKFHYFRVKYDFEEKFKKEPDAAEQVARAKKQNGEGFQQWFGRV